MFEKEIAETIREAFNLTQEDLRVTISSENGADIKLNAKAKTKFPFSVEAKRRASFDTLYRFMEQAKGHYPELIPLVVLRGDRKSALAIIDFDYFLTLISQKPIKIK